MFTKNNDPVVDSVKEVMKRNEIERRVESLVNEHFGVTSKKALPHEMWAEYDAILAEAKKCAMEELAAKDYDKDGKVESPKDEVWGSRFRAAKKAGKMEEEKEDDKKPKNKYEKYKFTQPGDKPVKDYKEKESKGSITRSWTVTREESEQLDEMFGDTFHSTPEEATEKARSTHKKLMRAGWRPKFSNVEYLNNKNKNIRLDGAPITYKKEGSDAEVHVSAFRNRMKDSTQLSVSKKSKPKPNLAEEYEELDEGWAEKFEKGRVRKNMMNRAREVGRDAAESGDRKEAQKQSRKYRLLDKAARGPVLGKSMKEESDQLDEISGAKARAAESASKKRASELFSRGGLETSQPSEFARKAFEAEKKRGKKFGEYADKKDAKDSVQKSRFHAASQVMSGAQRRKTMKALQQKMEEDAEQLDEKLTKSMSAGDIISDFVHSKDPKFAGKSKKERQKMALGAYYGMHPEKSRQVDEESVFEEIRANLEEQLAYAYENYDDASFADYVGSLTEEELDILGLNEQRGFFQRMFGGGPGTEHMGGKAPAAAPQSPSFSRQEQGATKIGGVHAGTKDLAKGAAAKAFGKQQAAAGTQSGSTWMGPQATKIAAKQDAAAAKAKPAAAANPNMASPLAKPAGMAAPKPVSGASRPATAPAAKPASRPVQRQVARPAQKPMAPRSRPPSRSSYGAASAADVGSSLSGTVAGRMSEQSETPVQVKESFEQFIRNRFLKD